MADGVPPTLRAGDVADPPIGRARPEAGQAGIGPAAHATQRPAALLYGPGHVIVHGNAPFRALFGRGFLGLPAAEALLDLPRAAFDLMDLVYREGRPLASWIRVRGSIWRLTIADRRDIDTGQVYGIAIGLVPPERTVSEG